jgi:hypothetical protein
MAAVVAAGEGGADDAGAGAPRLTGEHVGWQAGAIEARQFGAGLAEETSRAGGEP